MLGNRFVEHFWGTREHEVKLWNQTVTVRHVLKTQHVPNLIVLYSRSGAVIAEVI